VNLSRFEGAVARDWASLPEMARELRREDTNVCLANLQHDILVKILEISPRSITIRSTCTLFKTCIEMSLPVTLVLTDLGIREVSPTHSSSSTSDTT
jgi:hypothetical protein